MAKTVNYTDEQVAELTEAYTAVVDAPEADRDAVVAEYAAKFGKKPRSIIAKLSNLKIYVAKTPVAKDGEPAIKKDAAAAVLREVAGLPLTSAESLTKADIKALTALILELRSGQSDEDSDSA